MSDIVGGMVVALCVGLWLGFWFRGRQEKPPTLLERLTGGDLRLFMVKVRPFLRRPDWPTDAAIHLYNDGKVRVEATLLGGSTISAEGESLDAATAAIHRSVEMVKKAVPT